MKIKISGIAAILAIMPALAVADTVSHQPIVLDTTKAPAGNCQIVNSTYGEALLFTVMNTGKTGYIGRGVASLTPATQPALKRTDVLPDIAAQKTAVIGFALPGMCLAHACSFTLALPNGHRHEVHCE